MTKFEELIAKLTELFELEKADLDFGIHRIIKSKHTQIDEYLTKRLPATVKQVLGELAQAETASNLTDLKQSIRDNLAADAIDDDGNLADEYKATKLGKQYLEALKSATDAKAAQRIETEVYSHLYSFFSRYYEDADFISLRRRTAGKETYSIPYDGQEVVLHWTNKDQYYIKSSEDLKDYTFTTHVGEASFRVQFKLTRMDAIQNNNKASRIFKIDDEAEIKAEGNTLVIPFHFAEGKKRTNPQAAAWEQSVLDALPPAWQTRLNDKDTTYTGKDKDGRTILQKHLRNYTKKNTSDYFIHKDLGGFLRRELDFYIKNEVMYLDDIDRRPADYLEKELRKIKAVRAVAHDLIDFLAQFENFQKRIWLKKKFVIETNWCITLDRVPEGMYAEIAANDAQRAEWVTLFAIDEIEADALGKVAYAEPLTVEFLKANDTLVLDTANFEPDFKYRLLAAMQGHEDIDTHTNGLLVHSENFQALRLLQERYKGQAKCIYIDPPYNTGSDGFTYKDGYQQSTWGSMIYDRLEEGRKFATKDAGFFASIDENEQLNLRQYMNAVFGTENFVADMVWAAGRKNDSKLVSVSHEYILAYARDRERLKANKVVWRQKKKGLDDIYTQYKKLKKKHKNDYEAMTKAIKKWFKDLPDAHPAKSHKHYSHVDKRGIYFPDNISWPGGGGPKYEVLHPKTGKPVSVPSRGWMTSDPEKMKQWIADELVHFGDDESAVPCIKSYLKDRELQAPYSVFYQDGRAATKRLRHVLGSDDFGYPKDETVIADIVQMLTQDGDLVMDYFAGSGTTGHSVINLYREDGKKRKSILVEMGGYFDTVLLPRLKKVVYAADWKEGKPTTRDTGISHCFKYLRLESYEDALNNLELEDRTPDVLGLPEKVAEDYLLRYALDVETRASLLSLERFADPFGCTLKIYNRQTGEAEPTPIDLPETFNYLLGLRVRTMQMRDGFLVIEGENPAAETVLVIWRNVKEKNNKALEKFVTKMSINPADTEFAAIYINGDTTLDDPHKKILLIEKAFHELMFDVEGL